MAGLVLEYVVLYRLVPLPVLGENIDNPQCVHRLGSEHFPRQDHPYGGCGTSAAGQEAVGAHAREQVHEDLRQAKTGATFRYQHIAR